MSSKVPLIYPGLFAGPDEVRRAQRVALSHARESDDLSGMLADERELRLRVLIRSFFLWAFVGLPLIALALGLCAATLQAQKIIARDGYEAFPYAEYKGGHAGFPKESYGVLVLTDSTLDYWECRFSGCGDDKKGVWDPKHLFWSVPIKSITEVNASTRNKGPSVTGRVMFGVLATDNNEEYFGFTFETDKSAEAPVFKMPKTMAGALEAKVKFRLKKLGVAVPQL